MYRYAASVVVSLTYGKRVESVDERIVTEMMDSMGCSYFLFASSLWMMLTFVLNRILLGAADLTR